MTRTLAAIAALAMLTGCDVLFPEDPRIGAEAEQACITRVEEALRLEMAGVEGDSDTMFVPTYTFDITKLGLEAIQELSAGSGDETQGTRLNQATNMTSTAKDQFMAQSVDENGAFFLGSDPALYRVRGQQQRFADVVSAGCAMQRENMRLIDIDLASETLPEPEPVLDDPINPSLETER